MSAEDIADLRAVLVALVFVALAIVFAVWWTDRSDDAVNRQIEACLAAGGTPIVVGHQYTSEFKACDLP